ncbi:MAG: hypothetical protein WCF84_07125 [Anaerolineae bacterium]
MNKLTHPADWEIELLAALVLIVVFGLLCYLAWIVNAGWGEGMPLHNFPSFVIRGTYDLIQKHL